MYCHHLSISSESLYFPSPLRPLAPGEQGVCVWSLHLQSAAGLLAPRIVGQSRFRHLRLHFTPAASLRIGVKLGKHLTQLNKHRFLLLVLGSWSYSLRVIKSEVAQSCPTLCDPMGCSLPGSSLHGIFQAIVLE